MLNPALTEMVASDRIRELQAAAAKRSSPVRPPARSIRPVPVANPQRALGWFLVSVGLRLALPRARTGSLR